MMFEKLSRDVVIDFGTASVLVYVQGQGIVLKEPSVVAIDTTTDHVVKVGQDAMEMLGRTPDHIKAVRPMKDGVVDNYDVALEVLRYYIRRACGKVWIPPRVMICVPTGITELQMRAFMEASHEAGARRTYLIEEAKAAALGAGLDITSPIGSMVVNIGGGVSDIAVLSMGGIVVADSIRIGGDKFDEAIQSYIRRRYNILIGERTAEDIKIRIGDVYDHKKPGYMRVAGRSLSDGAQREVLLSSKEMLEALYEPITAILDSICSVIEHTPPELVGDILQKGMILTGGGSLLRGLDRLIERVTGIPVYMAKKPISATVLGAGSLLPQLGSMPEGPVQISSLTAPVRANASGRSASTRDDRRVDDRRSGDRFENARRDEREAHDDRYAYADRSDRYDGRDSRDQRASDRREVRDERFAYEQRPERVERSERSVPAEHRAARERGDAREVRDTQNARTVVRDTRKSRRASENRPRDNRERDAREGDTPRRPSARN